MANPGNVTVNITGTLGGINTSNITAATIGNSGNLYFARWQEPPRPCHNRRGGPNSRTYCEIYECVYHTDHMGRSPSGKWFYWKDRNEA